MFKILAMWGVSRSTLLAISLALCLVLAVAACNRADETPTPADAVEPATPTPNATPVPASDPTATPSSDPVATPTQTDDDDETQAVLASVLKTYTDDLYGYSVDIPVDWTAMRPETGLRSRTILFETGDEDITASSLVIFADDEVDPEEIASEQAASLAGTSGFSTLNEGAGAITLEDGTELYEVLYGFGTGANEHRGSVTFVARGTTALGVHIEAPRRLYERNGDILEAVSRSIRPVAPQPFGTPRDETLVVFLGESPLTADPGIATSARAAQYIYKIFSGLVLLEDDLIPQPDLAEWEVSDDGTVYTFTIRDDAVFHNGDPVTAQQVIFSWERALNPNLGTVGGGGGSYLDDIVGAKEYAAGEADSVAGLEAVDDSTLRVTIDEAKSYFLSKLAHTAAYVVHPDNVPEVPSQRAMDDEEASPSSTDDADDEVIPDPWYYTAIGTGPYRLAHWERSRAIHLTAFEDYLGPPQSVPNLVFRFHAGLPTAMVEEGFVDATTRVWDRTYTELVEEESPLVDQFTLINSLSIQYLAFNPTTAPFDDPDVRRAFLWAVDRESIFDAQGLSNFKIAHGFMPPGLPGYDENIAEIKYDPDAAKELFDGTDFGKLPEEERVIVVIGSGELSDFRRAIFEDWRDNLDVQVRYNPGIDGQYLPEYYNNYFRFLPNLIEAGINIYEYGWLADYPDPHDFLDVLFHTESPSNDGKIGSAEIDALLETARTAGDDRLEQYRAIERMMIDEAIAFPLYFGHELLLVSERVKNLSMDALGHLRIADVEFVEE